VKVHVSAILRALNVHTRAQAIAELARRGVAAHSVHAH
jgi:DNA-binding NarL/FixJ family response regulator